MGDLKEIVTEAIEDKLKESFIRGMSAGWTACATHLNKICKTKTSASEIKKILKIESEKNHINEFNEQKINGNSD